MDGLYFRVSYLDRIRELGVVRHIIDRKIKKKKKKKKKRKKKECDSQCPLVEDTKMGAKNRKNNAPRYPANILMLKSTCFVAHD